MIWSSPSLQLQAFHTHLLPPNVTRFPISLPKSQNFPKPLLTTNSKLPTVHPHLVLAKSPNSDRAPRKLEEEKFTHEGSVTESLPNGMFRVRLDNQDMIIGYISGSIRKNYIRILPGDRVRVEVSRYDSSRGRIIYRLRNTKDGSS
ncbi:Translation initiation factor IF-1, chloroplastic [Morella rubra]|uniref:Translation initiation factor IF-1, chloroplastic n=1 Tax=Morella rubra TaxID=262757 RepID=A0A6A1VYF2_9ROSI|nr:Translation initiation factor IF-1, chloroplastic [Morella rubra]KAB1216588.1 Translation initiation factor IF-1, chloroplastic [Morella rubra]